MAFLEQTDREIYYALKEQSVKGTYETGAGATLIPFTNSPGITQENVDVQSQISRRDLLTQLGDYGQGSAPFSMNSELIIGAHDLIDQAVMRSTFQAAVTKTESSWGTITGVSSKTVTFSGTFDGKVGDVHVYTTGVNTADRNTPFIVEAATANTVTYHKAPVTSGAVATFSVGVRRHVIDGETDRAFTVEERFASKGFSAIGEWLRFAEATWGFGPNQPIARSWRGRGAQMVPLAPASANFTSPTESTGLALSAANVTLAVAGSVVGKLSACQINYTRPDFLPPTSTPIAEDVGLGAVRLTGSVTILKDSQTHETTYTQRTKGFSIGLLFTEPAASGLAPFLVAYMPYCRWTNATRSGAGREGFTTSTLSFEAGVDLRGGFYPKTMLKLSSSV